MSWGPGRGEVHPKDPGSPSSEHSQEELKGQMLAEKICEEAETHFLLF